MALYYNKSLFEKYGWKPPTNLKELETLACGHGGQGHRAVRQGNADWKGANEWLVTTVFNQYAGPDNLAKAMQGKLAVDRSCVRRCHRSAQELVGQGLFRQELFLPHHRSRPSISCRREGGHVPERYLGVSMVKRPLPIPAGAGNRAHSLLCALACHPAVCPGHRHNLSISKTSKNPDCAAAALNFIYSPLLPEHQPRLGRGLECAAAQESTRPACQEYHPAVRRHHRRPCDAVGKGNFGYTTWTFLPPKTDSYLISGIEQVWLSGLSSKAYLQKLNDTFQRRSRRQRDVHSDPAR